MSDYPPVEEALAAVICNAIGRDARAGCRITMDDIEGNHYAIEPVLREANRRREEARAAGEFGDTEFWAQIMSELEEMR